MNKITMTLQVDHLILEALKEDISSEDVTTNSVMMPLAALATCILILRVVGIDGMVKEIEQSSPFRRKKLYRVFIKYFAPICLIIILLSSIAIVLGIISM